MSMVGTFDGFTAARLGLYAAQHGLRVTGNNVSNINTAGYTRQRADQVSFKAGANDMYRSFYDNHVGSGALVTSISQLRDPYLDIRFRNASTDTYHYDTWLAGLQNIASILDEVGKGDNEDGLIYKAIQDLAEKLRSYSANPTSLNDRLVRNSAESLTLLFHNAAGRLEKLYNETVSEFNEDITATNEILTNIRDLNKSIREAEIHGDAALEMRDERNRQIDALSQYLDIKVEYSYETVGGGIEVEKLTIKLNNANPDPTVTSDESILVDGVFATQLSVPKEKPALNMFDENNPDDKDYLYLNEYLYRREVTEKQALRLLGIDDDDDAIAILDGLLAKAKNADGTLKTDAAGKPIYLFGTNDCDEDGVVTETNDNFTIQLSRLLNSKGEAWKSSSTAWTEVDLQTVIANATFAYTIGTDLSKDDSFVIVGTDENGNEVRYTYQVVDDGYVKNGTEDFIPIEASKAKDPEKLAEFLADEFGKLRKYDGYEITSDGADILFKAKYQENPDDYPKEIPSLSLTDNSNTGWITLSKRKTIPTETYDEHGNVTKAVNYVLVNGLWNRVTVSTQHTHEVTLDDNDLRGILQAEREMLTEEGEFASAKDVAIDESALTKRGIKYYQKSLDLLAQKFAKAYNQLNVGYAYNQNGNYIDKDGHELLINDYVYDENGKQVFEDDAATTPKYEPKPVSTDGLTEGQLKWLMTADPDDLPKGFESKFDIKDYVLQNKDNYLVDENGSLITDEKGKPIHIDDLGGPDIEELLKKAVIDMDGKDGILEKLGGWRMGGDLFTNLDGESTTGITAATISVSHGWGNGLWNLVPTFEMLFSDDENGGLTNSTQNTNADHMIAMIENALTYNPRDLDGSDAIGPELFSGSFNDMLSNMMAKQGEDASMTNVRLTTAAGIMNEMDYSREGVSGVDLNDEAMNMITYQKAMSAAMRVMTAIDEVLDRLINNTGIAGR